MLQILHARLITHTMQCPGWGHLADYPVGWSHPQRRHRQTAQTKAYRQPLLASTWPCWIRTNGLHMHDLLMAIGNCLHMQSLLGKQHLLTKLCSSELQHSLKLQILSQFPCFSMLKQSQQAGIAHVHVKPERHIQNISTARQSSNMSVTAVASNKLRRCRNKSPAMATVEDQCGGC